MFTQPLLVHSLFKKIIKTKKKNISPLLTDSFLFSFSKPRNQTTGTATFL